MHRSSRRGCFLALRMLLTALLVVVLCTALSAAITPNEQRLLSAVSIEHMMSNLDRLCCDDFRGRRAGSPEHYAVADYLVSQFRQYGLSPLDASGLDGYKQPLTMRYSLIRSKDEIKATLSYEATGGSRSRTFAYRGYNGNGGLDLRSEVVFVGHGISASSGHDDYSGLDVTGKIVMWLLGAPAGVDTRLGTASRKLVTAYQHGAVGCLTLNSIQGKPDGQKDEWGANVGLAGSIADFPYIAIDDKVASELFPEADIRRLRPGARGTTARLRVTPVRDPARPTCNVVGVIPGSDPAVADEIVLIGAHYDHIGADPKGGIFRGADDNASGTSVVLEIAKAFSESGLRPRRTIVFASWTGEEAGLVGSNYFAANPPFPLKKIVSSIQLDMVGAGIPGRIRSTGATAYPEHFRHLVSGAEDLGIDLRSDVSPGASDHLAFTRKGVPTSLIYADGEHPNYHSVRDTPSAINRNVLEPAARLAVLSVWRAASS